MDESALLLAQSIGMVAKNSDLPISVGKKVLKPVGQLAIYLSKGS